MKLVNLADSQGSQTDMNFFVDGKYQGTQGLDELSLISSISA